MHSDNNLVGRTYAEKMRKDKGFNIDVLIEIKMVLPLWLIFFR